MSGIIQNAIRLMADEHQRLDKFVKDYALQDGSVKRSERAALLTTHLAIATENHGFFMLDQSEIMEILNTRRDRLAEELKHYTALGAKIQQT